MNSERRQRQSDGVFANGSRRQFKKLFFNLLLLLLLFMEYYIKLQIKKYENDL